MKVSTAVAVIAYASCASAFITIPENLPDGIYEAEQPANPDHQPLIRRVDNLPPPDSSPAAGPAARLRRANSNGLGPIKGPPTDKRIGMFDTVPLPKTKEFCRDKSHTMSLADFRTATNELFYTPMFWLPAKSVRFVLHRSAIAYMCNPGKGWEVASLVEYMEAMGILDERCGVPEAVAAPANSTEQIKEERMRAAKLSVISMNKFYGREIPGEPICASETWSKTSSLRNPSLRVYYKGCKSYVYHGIGRNLTGGQDRLDEPECNRNVSGEWMWEKLKGLFPWYQREKTAHGPRQVEEADRD